MSSCATATPRTTLRPLSRHPVTATHPRRPRLTGPLARRRRPPPSRRQESLKEGVNMEVPHKLLVLIGKLKSAGCTPIRREGEEYRCRCPAHDDNGPSLYIRT